MSEHLLGITPVLKRLAFHFVLKGLGSHPVEAPFNALYDEVIVRELYPWTVPDKETPQGGVVVEFWMVGQKIRWVEFGVRMIGSGGSPILREV